MEKLTFSVDSALLSELGEKLVESAHVALLELVKNAYDADATHVTLKIIPQALGGPELHVVDDGTGMSFDDVKKYWMRVATTHKADQTQSSGYGRPRTGSKGIGRFSCRRLGARLKLITTAKVSARCFERTEITINWSDFTPGSDITDITCNGAKALSSEGTIGTSLIISGATVDEWSKRGYSFLKRQLAVLAANRGTRRKGYSEDPGFNVSLEAPGFGEKLKNLRDSLLCAGWGDITAEVTKEGICTATLNAMQIGKRTITYPEKFPKLAGVKVRIGVLIDRREQMRKKDMISKGSLREILEEWGGVFIRFNGFRVYPYGEPGNDWLDIDADRGLRRGTVPNVLEGFARKLQGVDPSRALLQLLSSRGYVGDVDLDFRATGFEMKASREGFVRSNSVDELKTLIRFLVDWATIYRDYYLRVPNKMSQAA